MSDTLIVLLNQFMSVVPRLFSALLAFIIGYLVVKIVSKTIIRLLEAIKIDKLGEKLNEIEIIGKANIKIKLSQLLGKILHYFLLLFVILISVDILNLEAISSLMLDLFILVPKIIVAFAILILGLLVAEMIRKLVDTTLRSLALPSAGIIANFIFYFLFINVIVVAVAQTGITTAFLEQNISIIIAGGVLAFSIGYGLASKDVMSNYLSSFYVKNKINVGDQIIFGSTSGMVVEIDKTAVCIVAEDQKIYIPLKSIINDKIIIKNKQLKLE